MKLYISNTPITFPHSEYGGTIAITAKNIAEWEDILRAKYKRELDNGDFDFSIAQESIKEFPLLLTKDYASEVVYEFLT